MENLRVCLNVANNSHPRTFFVDDKEAQADVKKGHIPIAFCTIRDMDLVNAYERVEGAIRETFRKTSSTSLRSNKL